MGLLKCLYISGDIEWLDRGQRQPAILAPGEELITGAGVCTARIRVADIGGKEFYVAPGRAGSLRSAISAGTTGWADLSAIRFAGGTMAGSLVMSGTALCLHRAHRPFAKDGLPIRWFPLLRQDRRDLRHGENASSRGANGPAKSSIRATCSPASAAASLSGPPCLKAARMSLTPRSPGSSVGVAFRTATSTAFIACRTAMSYSPRMKARQTVSAILGWRTRGSNRAI